jgi:hypothetical protein
VLGARVDRDWSTHIIVSATCLVVVVLVLTRIRITGIHVFVNVATGWGLWAIVVVRRVVGGVVWWIRGIGKVAIYRGRWRGRKVVGRWEVSGVVVGTSSRLTRAVSTRTVAFTAVAPGTVAVLTVGRLVFI